MVAEPVMVNAAVRNIIGQTVPVRVLLDVVRLCSCHLPLLCTPFIDFLYSVYSLCRHTHLHTTTGVRARQEKMPFAMIDDPVMVNAAVRTLIGQTVALQVTPDNVILAPASSDQAAAAAAASSGGRKANGNGASGGAAAVSKVSTPRLVELLDCTPSLAGAKASACARLEQVRYDLKNRTEGLGVEGSTWWGLL
jgi:hypothetical protein